MATIDNRLADPVSCRQDAVYVFCIAERFLFFLKIVLLSVAVALTLSI